MILQRDFSASYNGHRVRGHLCRLGVLCLLWLVLSAACLQQLTPEGAPCRDDSDCWSGLKCIQTQCLPPGSEPSAREQKGESIPDSAEPAPEPTPEPTPEPPPPLNCATPEPNGRGLHEPCSVYDWAPASEKCQCGLYCHRLTATSSVCMRDCTKSDRYCEEEPGTVCRLLDWRPDDSPQKACVKEAAFGAGCDPSNGVYCKSQVGQATICRNNKCTSASVAKIDQSCAPDDTPPVVCDLGSRLLCHSRGSCVKGRRKFEWDLCNDDLCPKGTVCKSLASSTGAKYCTRSCQATSDCKQYPEAAMSCFGGLCTQINCKKDNECVFQRHGMICGSPGQGPEYCGPKDLLGERLYMETCTNSSTVLAELCAGGLRCVQFGANLKESLCTTSCDDDRDCQRFDKRDKCVVPTVNQQTGKRVTYCGRLCNADQDCPPSYRCLSPGGFGVCFPPSL